MLKMSTSEVSSIQSTKPSLLPQKKEQNNDENIYNIYNTSKNIITRTLSHIKEDNRFAKTQIEPDPSYDPLDLNRVGTAVRSQSNKSIYKEFEWLPFDGYRSQSENKTETENVLENTGEYNIYDVENKPPDKGFWAWTAALCVMSINTFTWGATSSFGIYLNYYISKDYFEGATMEQYVMIGGLVLGLTFMATPITNSLIRRFHYKIIMSIGAAIIFLAYWLASISTTVVQLIMFQGLLLSIGYALITGAIFVILPAWFLKKRSISQGIASAGSSLGGIIFSRPIDQIIKNYLNNPKYANNQREALRLGVSWSLRMLALVCGFMLVISIIFVRTYKPLKDPRAKEKPFFKELFAFLFRFDLLQMVPMISLILWNMVYGLTYAILLFSLSSYATAIGLSYQQGSNITTIQSVAQTIGRPLIGICSDKIGRANTTIILTMILTLLIFFFWIFVTTYNQLIAFACLAGLILGVNWVNFGPITADVVGGGGDDLNHAISLELFTSGAPLLVAELAGLKLERSEMAKPFLYCQILCGVASFVSVLLLMPLREWKVKRILLSRRKQFEYLLNYNDDAHYNDGDNIRKKIPANINDNEEIKGLDGMLQNSVWAYCLRMFYPIIV